MHGLSARIDDLQDQKRRLEIENAALKSEVEDLKSAAAVSAPPAAARPWPPPPPNKTLLGLSALFASGEAMERFLSQISGRGCQGDRRGRRKHRTCAQGVGEVRCGLASNPRQPIASSPCHVDKSAIMTAERSRSRTGGGRPFKVLAELHEHRAPFLARWPETAAGFAIALPPSELIGVAETARAR